MITTLLIIIACFIAFRAGFKAGYNDCEEVHNQAILEQIEKVKKEFEHIDRAGKLFEKENQ